MKETQKRGIWQKASIFIGGLLITWTVVSFVPVLAHVSSPSCALKLYNIVKIAQEFHLSPEKIYVRDLSLRLSEIKSLVEAYKSHKHLRLSYEPFLDTLIRHSKRGRLPDFRPVGPGEDRRPPLPTQVFMPMFAGAGGRASHSGSLEVAIKIFTQPVTGAKRGLVAKLQSSPFYVRIGAEALDLVGQRFGPAAYQYPRVSSIKAWLNFLFRFHKERHPDIPLIPLARSASANFILEYHRENPGILDGLILVGPLHPSEGFKKNTEALIGAIRNQPEAQLQIESFQWTRQLLKNLAWYQNLEAFQDLPILTLFGESDPQASPELINAFERLSSQNPKGKLLRLPGGHFLMGSDSNPERAIRTYEEIYRFVSLILQKDD